MPRVAPIITVSDDDQRVLRRWARGRRTPARLVRRAKIVLRAADGWLNQAIAVELGVQEKTVGLWRRRFAEYGTAGIEKDAGGRGRPATVQHSAVEAAVVRKTTQEPPRTATHWSTRTLAADLGISPASVQRIWQRHGLKPHLVRTFKVSNDLHVAVKLDEIVGLYLNPPAQALVFSVDEKSQIQALDRTQPGLPITQGRAGTMTGACAVGCWWCERIPLQKRPLRHIRHTIEVTSAIWAVTSEPRTCPDAQEVGLRVLRGRETRQLR